MPADVAAYIGRWEPWSVTAEAAAFARDVISQVAPGGRERAKNLTGNFPHLEGSNQPPSAA